MFDPRRLDEGEGIYKTLCDNKAGYHKKGYAKFNKQEQSRAESRFLKRQHQSIAQAEQPLPSSSVPVSPKKLRSSTSMHTPNMSICCY